MPAGPSYEKQMNASAPVDAEPTGLQVDDQKLDQEEDKFPIKLPNGMTEKFLIDYALKQKKQHERWFGTNNGFQQEMLDAWKAYDGKLLRGQSTPVTIPVVNSVVETDMAKSYQAAFSKAKVVDAQPLVPQDNNENKQTIEDLMNQEILFGRSRTGEKALDFMKAMKIEGTGFARAKWEKRFIETINVPMQMDMSTGVNMPMKTVAQSKAFRAIHGPDFDPEAVQNVIWDHRVGTRIQDSEIVGHRQFPTITDLLIMQENGEIANVDAIQRLAQGQNVEQMNPDARRKQQLAPSGTAGTSEGSSEDAAKRLDEWFAWVPYQCPQEDGSKRWEKVALHWTIVNDEVLVMCEPNPWVDESGHGPGHPFISYRQMIHPRDLLGKGVAAPIMELQVSVNNTHSSTSKLVSKAARNPTFVSRAAGLDTLRLFVDELTVIPVLDSDKVKFHPVDGAAIDAVSKERAWLINMARETVAANEQSQGVATPTLANGTATEASIINANSGTRFQLGVDLFGYEFFAGLANLYWWMMRQWAAEGDLVVRESSIDGAPRPITRAHLVDDYFFVPITSSVLNDQRAQLQSKMQLAQQLAQLQATNPAAMMDENGAQYKFDLIDFIIKEIMPLMGVRNGRTYLQKIQAVQQAIMAGVTPQAPGVAPGAPGMPPAALPAHPGIPTPPVQGPHPALPVAPQPGFTPAARFEA